MDNVNREDNKFSFSVIDDGVFLLKLPHYQSSRNISYEQLKEISFDLRNYLIKVQREFSIEPINKGSLICYRYGKIICDNDNTVFSDIFNILKRTNIIESDLPQDFSISYFACKSDKISNDYLFIFDESKNPLNYIDKKLNSILEERGELSEK